MQKNDNFQKMQTLVDRAQSELMAEQKIKSDLFNAEKKLLQARKQPTGIASQYKGELAKCAFKLIVYWRVNKHGVPYTQAQIDSYENLKKIPSIDFDTYKRLNHEDAYNALCDKVYEQAPRMFKAILVRMDYFNSQEHWIASFNTSNLMRSNILPVYFKPKDENGNILFDYFEGLPIRTNQMRFYEK